ncbi:MAG: type II secretion system protein GspL [Thermodesulfobacteriota bacterium]|nr:type II secretion system protein GspL [Thermodesulfobacteriota bacterium]
MDGRVLGIDIGNTTVCAVLVGPGDSGLRIEAHAHAAMGKDVSPWQVLPGVLDALGHRADWSSAACVATFPDRQVSYRRIHMPFADPRKIEKVIAYELEPLLPFAPADLFIDFVVLFPAVSQENEAGVEVLAAAVHKEKVKEWIDGFAGAGLQPEMIVPRGWAAAAVLSADVEDALLVETSGGYVTTAVVGGGDVQWVRFFSAGTPPDQEAGRSALCDGLRQTLLACEYETGVAAGLKNVFVAGADLRAGQAAKTVAACLGIDARPLNMADGSSLVTGGRPDHTWEPGLLDMALCPALLKKSRKPCINFRKGEFSLAARWLQYRHLFGGTAALAALVLVLGLMGVFYDLYSLNRSIAAVDARRQAIFRECFPESAAAPSAEMMRYEIDRLRESSGLPAGLDRTVYQVDILNDISRLVPRETDVVITRLDAGLNDVSVTGNTDAFQSVDTMKNRLEESDLFGTVVISSATMDKADKRVHFKLQMELKS